MKPMLIVDMFIPAAMLIWLPSRLKILAVNHAHDDLDIPEKHDCGILRSFQKRLTPALGTSHQFGFAGVRLELPCPAFPFTIPPSRHRSEIRSKVWRDRFPRCGREKSSTGREWFSQDVAQTLLQTPCKMSQSEAHEGKLYRHGGSGTKDSGWGGDLIVV